MEFETVWQAFEHYYPGSLKVSIHPYESQSDFSLSDAKNAFPRKAPARLITEKRTYQRTGLGKSPWNEYENAEHIMPDAKSVLQLISILSEAERQFEVVFKPRAELGRENQGNLHPEMRIFLSPGEVFRRKKFLERIFRPQMENETQQRAQEILHWIAQRIGARPMQP